MATESVANTEIDLTNALARIQSSLDALFGLAGRLSDEEDVGTIYCITHTLEGARTQVERASGFKVQQ